MVLKLKKNYFRLRTTKKPLPLLSFNLRKNSQLKMYYNIVQPSLPALNFDITEFGQANSLKNVYLVVCFLRIGSASHTVCRQVTSWPGHTKDHHKNVTDCLPVWHAMR